MKAIKIIARILFIIAVPAFCISLSIGIAVNSQWLYEAGFKKYNIVAVTGITLPELSKAASGIINYFNNSDEYLEVTITRNGQAYQLYSEDPKQINHMKDVKALFRLDYGVLLVSFVIIAAYAGIAVRRKKFRDLAKSLITGGGITLGLIILLGIGVLTGFFNALFIGFHHMAFSNTDWLLDPAVHVLIQMFPEPFWQDAVSFIGLLIIGMSIVTTAAGVWWLRKQNRSMVDE